MTEFSPKYSTYQDWKKANPGNGEYENRIKRLHSLHPKASLSQLRGHPSKKRKPLSKLKPRKQRKKPTKVQIVVSGNMVKNDRSYVMNMYTEFYIRSARTEEQIATEIFNMIQDKGIRMYREDEENTVIVNFREKLLGNKGKVISQKKAKQQIIEAIESNLRQPNRDRTKEYEQRKMKRIERRKQQQMKKERYDNNGI